MKSFIIFVALSVFINSCARAPLKTQKMAMRQVPLAKIEDDLPLEPLLKATEDEIQYLEKNPSPSEFIFGTEHYTQAEYLEGLRRFVELGKKMPHHSFLKAVQSEFDFYEVYGRSRWGEVFITSYFEPVINGSLKQTKAFSTPLYQVPDDLITLDLALFDSKFESERKLRGRIQNQSLVPYYTRKEIDSEGSLKNRNLEICWIDPIDAFFLQIQGSGTIFLENGNSLFVNYADKNGQPYEALGKFLTDFIPLEKMTLQTIESFLRKQPKEKLQDYLNKNPSYVFFKTSQAHAVTHLGLPATGGRTIATDKNFFPKGALALLTFQKPIFSQSDSLVPTSYQTTTRFVLDQDIGGAITGGGRVDLFWGRGEESKRSAGNIKQIGSLYYLAPKRATKAQSIQKKSTLD